MNLTDLAHGEPWMDPEERQTAAKLVQSFQQLFTDRQIPDNPFLVLRVEDVLLHHTLCRRLECNLTSGPDPVTPALAGQIGKARDRRRKSLKELEDTVAKLTPRLSDPPTCPSPELSAQVPPSPAPSSVSPSVSSSEASAQEEALAMSPAPSHSSHSSHSSPSSHNSQPLPSNPKPVPQANPHVPVSRPLPPHIYRHR